jgi:hypothetical protein
MSKGRVGEDRGSKETDRCPLTLQRWMCGELFQVHFTAGAEVRKDVLCIME